MPPDVVCYIRGILYQKGVLTLSNHASSALFFSHSMIVFGWEMSLLKSSEWFLLNQKFIIFSAAFSSYSRIMDVNDIMMNNVFASFFLILVAITVLCLLPSAMTTLYSFPEKANNTARVLSSRGIIDHLYSNIALVTKNY